MLPVFVISLHVLMSRVFMADAGEHDRTRLYPAIRIQAVVLLAVIVAWSPLLARIFVY